jgi:hypothetical protein
MTEPTSSTSVADGTVDLRAPAETENPTPGDADLGATDHGVVLLAVGDIP